MLSYGNLSSRLDNGAADNGYDQGGEETATSSHYYSHQPGFDLLDLFNTE